MHFPLFWMALFFSLQTEIKKLMSQFSSQEKQFKKKNHDLLEDYKRNIQQYESLQSKIK